MSVVEHVKNRSTMGMASRGLISIWFDTRKKSGGTIRGWVGLLPMYNEFLVPKIVVDSS